MHLKVSSGKWRPSFFGLNVLMGMNISVISGVTLAWNCCIFHIPMINFEVGVLKFGTVRSLKKTHDWSSICVFSWFFISFPINLQYIHKDPRVSKKTSALNGHTSINTNKCAGVKQCTFHWLISNDIALLKTCFCNTSLEINRWKLHCLQGWSNVHFIDWFPVNWYRNKEYSLV